MLQQFQHCSALTGKIKINFPSFHLIFPSETNRRRTEETSSAVIHHNQVATIVSASTIRYCRMTSDSQENNSTEVHFSFKCSANSCMQTFPVKDRSFPKQHSPSEPEKPFEWTTTSIYHVLFLWAGKSICLEEPRRNCAFRSTLTNGAAFNDCVSYRTPRGT